MTIVQESWKGDHHCTPECIWRQTPAVWRNLQLLIKPHVSYPLELEVGWWRCPAGPTLVCCNQTLVEPAVLTNPPLA